MKQTFPATSDGAQKSQTDRGPKMRPRPAQQFLGRSNMTGIIRAHKMLWLLVLGLIVNLAWQPSLAFALMVSTHQGFALSDCEFHRTFPVTGSDPVTLDVHLSEAELRISYGRQEQVSIAAIARGAVGGKADKESFVTALTVEQDGNHLRIRDRTSEVSAVEKVRIVCSIDVPYRTEIYSVVDDGKQTITGIMGPVNARARKGDIKVSYVSKGVLAETGSGNLDLQVIGEHVEARTGNGNISCIRAVQGARAETESGDIVLMIVGPSEAKVKKGTGRIDVGGARGSFTGSTAEGDLHIKAMPHDDWRLVSASGNIRIEVPPAARFEVDATTDFGELLVDRVDIERPLAEARHFHRNVNGGGRQIQVRTDTGKIAIR